MLHCVLQHPFCSIGNGVLSNKNILQGSRPSDLEYGCFTAPPQAENPVPVWMRTPCLKKVIACVSCFGARVPLAKLFVLIHVLRMKNCRIRGKHAEMIEELWKLIIMNPADGDRPYK